MTCAATQHGMTSGSIIARRPQADGRTCASARSPIAPVETASAQQGLAVTKRVISSARLWRRVCSGGISSGQGGDCFAPLAKTRSREWSPKCMRHPADPSLTGARNRGTLEADSDQILTARRSFCGTITLWALACRGAAFEGHRAPPAKDQCLPCPEGKRTQTDRMWGVHCRAT